MLHKIILMTGWSAWERMPSTMSQSFSLHGQKKGLIKIDEPFWACKFPIIEEQP